MVDEMGEEAIKKAAEQKAFDQKVTNDKNAAAQAGNNVENEVVAEENLKESAAEEKEQQQEPDKQKKEGDEEKKDETKDDRLDLLNNAGAIGKKAGEKMRRKVYEAMTGGGGAQDETEEETKGAGASQEATGKNSPSPLDDSPQPKAAGKASGEALQTSPALDKLEAKKKEQDAAAEPKKPGLDDAGPSSGPSTPPTPGGNMTP